ncbi:hypothetical protein [Leptothoe sp. PORK10 BA2]|uniref:hypothetical protein n=1 Tax=Leptothoe sp. PORK10 BA2 TaxID=3110254 RepID=UPI002B1FA16B|nr:hypothetical protein [Leptothoe sp. PORK10 BA2]MEA5465730.1 hypothetical protein [Leptothoe sp. PORK10 BA2]
MSINWPTLGRQPQTYGLLLGTALGFGLLVSLAGNRPVTWVGGGAVATVMVGSWIKGYGIPPVGENDDTDLLDAASFQRRIDAIQAQVSRDGDKTWQQVKTWALQSQAFAMGICDRESTLRAELLEALYTVVELAQQVADGLQVQAQIQTPAYRQMAKQRLQQSCDRMEQTYRQLQQLQDQVALASLSQGDTPLPQRLEILIAANKEILET